MNIVLTAVDLAEVCNPQDMAPILCDPKVCKNILKSYYGVPKMLINMLLITFCLTSPFRN